MSNPNDIPPVGAGSVMTQINHRQSKQQRHGENSGEKHKPAAKPLASPEQKDTETPSSVENHLGVDRYV